MKTVSAALVLVSALSVPCRADPPPKFDPKTACETRFLESAPNPDGSRHRYYEFCCPAAVKVALDHLWDTNAIPEAVKCKKLISDDHPACKTPGLKRYLCEPIPNCAP